MCLLEPGGLTPPCPAIAFGDGGSNSAPFTFSACIHAFVFLPDKLQRLRLTPPASALAAYMLAFSTPALNFLSASVCAALLRRIRGGAA